jgi:hypothetical protein
MKAVVLTWEETISNKIVVNVPDDFDVDSDKYSELLEEAIFDLPDDPYDACLERFGFEVESERPYDPRISTLFDDE